MCGWKRNQQPPDFSCYQPCHPTPKRRILAASQWTFSVGSQASLAFQRREDASFRSICHKNNLTYWENYHCVGKCRHSAELLNLEGGKEKSSSIMFKVSPEEKQMTQGILGQGLSYSIDAGNPERRSTLSNLWQNTFWSGFPCCLSPCSQLSKQALTFWS